MSMCRTWVEEEFVLGHIYPIATAQFRYNNTVVGTGTVTAKLSYDALTNTYAVELTITDSSTSTYVYNNIIVLDSNNVNVAQFTYSKTYSKGTGALTVTETIYIPQVFVPVNFLTYGITVQGIGEIIGNALINGGTINLPNYLFMFDELLVLVDQIQFTPSVNITPTTFIEYQTVTCQPCANQPVVTVVLVYFDPTSKTVIVYNDATVVGGFTTANIQWGIPFNPNC